MDASDLSDHVVVIGDSRVAKTVARQQAGAGTGGVAEAVAPDDADAAIAATGATRARLVFVDLPDDVSTLACVASLLDAAGSGPVPQIVANLRDPALRRTADDNLFERVSPRPRFVSLPGLAAEAAIASLRPYDLAHWRGQDRVHAVVIGFSALGRECFEALILAGIAGDLQPPRITILDRDPASVRKRLDRDMPEIGLSANVDVAPLDPWTMCAEGGALAAAEAALPLTLIVVSVGEPGLALEIMAALSRAQESGRGIVASVLVVTESRRGVLALGCPAGRARDLGRSWSVRGGIEDDPDVLGLLVDRSDRLAERVHDAYLAKFPGDGPGQRPWARLAETYRRASRRAADHLPVKLWTLGLRDGGRPSDPFAVEPRAFANVIVPCAAGTSEDALLRRLSRLEHDRWSAERRLDGWRHGVRDDARRIHDKLIPFDDPRLTDVDIDKDAEQIRFLFGTVVTAEPDGAVTPLVLGVLANTGGLPGIDVPSALDLCRAEAWRPVVVVSGLLDASECGLLDELARELAREGRDWRLIVPEVSRGNREIRAIVDPAELTRLDAWLARPSTRFAPIGAGVVAAADLWADPSEPDPHATAIASFVAARATAVIASAAAITAPVAPL